MPTTNLKKRLANGSIQVYLDGFCFCGPKQSAFIAYNESSGTPFNGFENTLNEFFSATPAVLLFDAPATHVPNTLFDPSLLSTYYAFYEKLPKNTKLNASKDSLGLVHTVFPEHQKYLAPIKKNYPNATVHHFQQLLYDCLYEHSKQDFKKNIYLHLQKNHFELYIFHGNALVLSNRFPHDGVETFMYYLFFVIETLGLDQEEYELNFLGKFDRYKSYYEGVQLFNTSCNFLFTEALKEDRAELPAPFFNF